MRTVFMAGGFVGFFVVVAAGSVAGRSWDELLRDAAIGALVGGFLFRWFWSAFVKSVGHAVKSKRAARQAAEEADAAARATPVVQAGKQN